MNPDHEIINAVVVIRVGIRNAECISEDIEFFLLKNPDAYILSLMRVSVCLGNVKPYSRVVRFDVCSSVGSDGFIMTDTTALKMLSDVIQLYKQSQLAALVISGTRCRKISEEQGYFGF